MVALSIDTANNFCAVAISDRQNGALLCEISKDIGTGHAEILMGTIEACMKQDGCSFQDFSRIISSTGPGSFTGVRVGLSCARAIALALSVPAIGISNLAACASYARQISGNSNGKIAAILDARRGEVYLQIFDQNGPCDSAKITSIEHLVEDHKTDLASCEMVCGNGVAAVMHLLKEKSVDFHPEITHTLATAPIGVFAQLGHDATPSTIRPVPLYLRGADAKVQSGFAVPRAEAGSVS